MQKMNVPVAGCVLSGGKSRRMGTDKALLELGGKALILHAIEHFSSFSEVLISAADPERYAFTGIRVVSDERPGIGPLGGVITVLKAIESASVCFRPVDAPLIPQMLHVFLAEACTLKNAAVPTYAGRAEPLLACFSKSALPMLELLAEKEDFKISNVFPLLDTVYVPLETEEMTQKLGDPSVWLVNANDMDTYKKLADNGT